MNDKAFAGADHSKDMLKELKKNDIIEKYNKDGQIRLDKQWLSLGSHLGANIYELYSDSGLYGFLSTSDGKLWDVTYYNYLGGFCDDNFELLEGDKRFWIDAEGVRRESNKDENGKYSGTSRFRKTTDGNYIITQNRNGKDYLILGDNALLNKMCFVADAPR